MVSTVTIAVVSVVCAVIGLTGIGLAIVAFTYIWKQKRKLQVVSDKSLDEKDIQSQGDDNMPEKLPTLDTTGNTPQSRISKIDELKTQDIAHVFDDTHQIKDQVTTEHESYPKFVSLFTVGNGQVTQSTKSANPKEKTSRSKSMKHTRGSRKETPVKRVTIRRNETVSIPVKHTKETALKDRRTDSLENTFIIGPNVAAGHCWEDLSTELANLNNLESFDDTDSDNAKKDLPVKRNNNGILSDTSSSDNMSYIVDTVDKTFVLNKTQKKENIMFEQDSYSVDSKDSGSMANQKQRKQKSIDNDDSNAREALTKDMIFEPPRYDSPPSELSDEEGNSTFRRPQTPHPLTGNKHDKCTTLYRCKSMPSNLRLNFIPKSKPCDQTSDIHPHKDLDNNLDTGTGITSDHQSRPREIVRKQNDTTLNVGLESTMSIDRNKEAHATPDIAITEISEDEFGTATAQFQRKSPVLDTAKQTNTAELVEHNKEDSTKDRFYGPCSEDVKQPWIVPDTFQTCSLNVSNPVPLPEVALQTTQVLAETDVEGLQHYTVKSSQKMTGNDILCGSKVTPMEVLKVEYQKGDVTNTVGEEQNFSNELTEVSNTVSNTPQSRKRKHSILRAATPIPTTDAKPKRGILKRNKDIQLLLKEKVPNDNDESIREEDESICVGHHDSCHHSTNGVNTNQLETTLEIFQEGSLGSNKLPNTSLINIHSDYPRQGDEIQQTINEECHDHLSNRAKNTPKQSEFSDGHVNRTVISARHEHDSPYTVKTLATKTENYSGICSDEKPLLSDKKSAIATSQDVETPGIAHQNAKCDDSVTDNVQTILQKQIPNFETHLASPENPLKTHYELFIDEINVPNSSKRKDRESSSKDLLLRTNVSDLESKTNESKGKYTEEYKHKIWMPNLTNDSIGYVTQNEQKTPNTDGTTVLIQKPPTTNALLNEHISGLHDIDNCFSRNHSVNEESTTEQNNHDELEHTTVNDSLTNNDSSRVVNNQSNINGQQLPDKSEIQSQKLDIQERVAAEYKEKQEHLLETTSYTKPMEMKSRIHLVNEIGIPSLKHDFQRNDDTEDQENNSLEARNASAIVCRHDTLDKLPSLKEQFPSKGFQGRIARNMQEYVQTETAKADHFVDEEELSEIERLGIRPDSNTVSTIGNKPETVAQISNEEASGKGNKNKTKHRSKSMVGYSTVQKGGKPQTSKRRVSYRETIHDPKVSEVFRPRLNPIKIPLSPVSVESLSIDNKTEQNDTSTSNHTFPYTNTSSTKMYGSGAVDHLSSDTEVTTCTASQTHCEVQPCDNGYIDMLAIERVGQVNHNDRPKSSKGRSRALGNKETVEHEDEITRTVNVRQAIDYNIDGSSQMCRSVRPKSAKYRSRIGNEGEIIEKDNAVHSAVTSQTLPIKDNRDESYSIVKTDPSSTQTSKYSLMAEHEEKLDEKGTKAQPTVILSPSGTTAYTKNESNQGDIVGKMNRPKSAKARSRVQSERTDHRYETEGHADETKRMQISSQSAFVEKGLKRNETFQNSKTRLKSIGKPVERSKSLFSRTRELEAPPTLTQNPFHIGKTVKNDSFLRNMSRYDHKTPELINQSINSNIDQYTAMRNKEHVLDRKVAESRTKKDRKTQGSVIHKEKRPGRERPQSSYGRSRGRSFNESKDKALDRRPTSASGVSTKSLKTNIVRTRKAKNSLAYQQSDDTLSETDDSSDGAEVSTFLIPGVKSTHIIDSNKASASPFQLKGQVNPFASNSRDGNKIQSKHDIPSASGQQQFAIPNEFKRNRITHERLTPIFNRATVQNTPTPVIIDGNSWQDKTELVNKSRETIKDVSSASNQDDEQVLSPNSIQDKLTLNQKALSPIQSKASQVSNIDDVLTQHGDVKPRLSRSQTLGPVDKYAIYNKDKLTQLSELKPRLSRSETVGHVDSYPTNNVDILTQLSELKPRLSRSETVGHVDSYPTNNVDTLKQHDDVKPRLSRSQTLGTADKYPMNLNDKQVKIFQRSLTPSIADTKDVLQNVPISTSMVKTAEKLKTRNRFSNHVRSRSFHFN